MPTFVLPPVVPVVRAPKSHRAPDDTHVIPSIPGATPPAELEEFLAVIDEACRLIRTGKMWHDQNSHLPPVS